jgi:putative ATP-dependent endonuclease of the OLD family
MLLTLLSLQNFRCYQQISDVPLHRLTVFIGENDAGKTVFLEAVRILLTESRPLRTDFRQISKGVYSDKIILEAKFTLDKEDTLPNEWRTINGESLILRKTFGIDGSSSAEAVARRLKDQRFANFNNADAGTQKELLNSIGLEPAANKELRVAQLTDAIEGELLETEEGFIDIQFAQLVDHLPIFELTSATDFEQPHQIVQKTLFKFRFST